MKLALLIGINYTGQNNSLNGCINDVYNIKQVLTEQYDYLENNITILTDESEIKPTTANIINKLYELAIETKTKPDIEEIFVSYSGHGYYIRDSSGDEKDNKDEVIIPLNYSRAGVISDDMLNNIFSLINPNTRTIALFDCCHSGSILDLKYRYISGDYNILENKNCNVKSNIIMISGCMDNQTSSDAYGLDEARAFSGAMTSSFLHTLKKFDYDLPVFKLLKHMRNYLKEKNFTQVPQITSTNRITQTTIFSYNSSIERLSFMSKK